MKKKGFLRIAFFILPVSVSIWLFFNYINNPDGQSRIPSEVGYYIFLVSVLIAGICYSILKESEYSRKTIIKNAVVISLILMVCVGLDMFFHTLARGMAVTQNDLSATSTGFPINLPLLKSAIQIYGVRFITVLFIGNTILFGITWRRQKHVD
jgi:hypothetical protein